MKTGLQDFVKELPSLQVFEKDVINDGNQKSSLSFPNVRSAGTNTDLKLVDYRTILEEISVKLTMMRLNLFKIKKS